MSSSNARPTAISDPRKLIFDIGFHIGSDTDFYLKKGFEVVAVEANPVLAERGRQRFAAFIENGRFTLVEAAIHKEAGSVEFYINNEKSEWSSTFESIGSRTGNYNMITVPAVTFESLVHRYGDPYYVKVDIEGADVFVLEGLGKILEKPRYISVEATTIEWAALLYSHGYRKFKLVNQALNFSYKCPYPPLEGEFVDTTFDNFMSGPFGEETPGAWLDFEALAWTYLRFVNLTRDDPNIAWGWCDFHAKL